MHELTPQYYFDTEAFTHHLLFDGCAYVWEALDRMGPYLENFRLGDIDGEISDSAYLTDPEMISIGKGTVIEPGAYIQGPCIIGSNCLVRHGAYIRGNVITGDHCIIGHDTEIKGSILLDKAQAPHFAYVGDSILGNRTNLGAGSKCANLRFDGKSVSIHINGETIDTGRRKLGVILGDSSELGCNSVPNPGTLMGRHSFAYPCMNFGGFVPSEKILKPNELTARQ